MVWGAFILVMDVEKEKKKEFQKHSTVFFNFFLILWEREGQRGWHTEDFLFLLFPQRDFCGFRAGGVDIYNNGEWLVVSGEW